MTTPINILIDDVSVIDYVSQCSIKHDSGYCYSVDISFKSNDIISRLNPIDNFGQIRIKIIIGATEYQFLFEERNLSESPNSLDASIWGRSKHALLGQPYAYTITDTDITNHPWQSGKCRVSDVLTTLSSYVPSVSVNWQVEDYTILSGCLNVENRTPIDIIKSLADAIGAELYADIDGTLRVSEYQTSGAVVDEYTDIDDIVSLSERLDAGETFNSVVISGYETPDQEEQDEDDQDDNQTSRYLQIERVDNDEIHIGAWHRAILYFNPNTLPTFYPVPEDSIQINWADGGTKTITETIVLKWGKGNTSYPRLDGTTEVSGDESKPMEIVSDYSYDTYYQNISLMSTSIGEKHCCFYYSDSGDYSAYNFSVDLPQSDEYDPIPIDPVTGVPDPDILQEQEIDKLDNRVEALEAAQLDECDSVVLEKYTALPAVGQNCVVRCFAPIFQFSDTVAICSDGQYATITAEGDINHRVVVEKTETVQFINGSAELSYPVHVGILPGITIIDFINNKLDLEFGTGHVTCENGKKTIKINYFIGKTKYYAVSATVTYNTSYTGWEHIIPADWVSENFEFAFNFYDSSDTLRLTPLCDEKSINVFERPTGTEIRKDGQTLGYVDAIDVLTS